MDEVREGLYTFHDMDQQQTASNLQSTQQRNRTNFSPEQYEMLEKGAQFIYSFLLLLLFKFAKIVFTANISLYLYS